MGVRAYLTGAFTILLGILVLPPLHAKKIAADNPVRALQLFPGYSQALLAKQVDAATQSYPLSLSVDDNKGRVRQMLSRAPLSIEPLLYNALEEFMTAEGDRGHGYFDKVQQLNPRNRIAAMALHDLAIDQRRTDDALDQLDLLFRLDGDKPEYMTAAVQLATFPEGRARLQDRFAGNPGWARGFLTQLIRNGQDREFTLELLDIYSSNNPAERTKTLQESFLEGVMKDGQVHQAYAYWQSFLPAEAPPSLVFDGSFDGYDVPGPFTWTLRDTSQGFTELTGSGDLYVSFAGQESTLLAWQTLRLPKGQSLYLHSTSSGDIDPRRGAVQWVLKCEKSRTLLTTIPLPARSDEQKVTSAPFQLPDEDCDSQLLQLQGQPGEYPSRSTLLIHNVQITDTASS